MKFLVALALVCIGTASAYIANYGVYQHPGFPAIKIPQAVVAPPAAGPAAGIHPPGRFPATNAPVAVVPPTLAQDILEMSALVNMPAIEEIIHRYIRNDREFQTLVRVWNSYNCTMLSQQLYMQPEYVAFKIVWDTELLKSGPIEEFEMEGIFTLTNPNPFWGNQCSGVAGFVQEIRGAGNEFFLRQHINRKLMQRGSLFTVYQSMTQLPKAIDRVLSSPQAQPVLDELAAEGIDLKWILQPLYSICGFPQLPSILLPPPVTTTTTTTPAPIVISPSTEAVIGSPSSTPVALPLESSTVSTVAPAVAEVSAAPADVPVVIPAVAA